MFFETQKGRLSETQKAQKFTKGFHKSFYFFKIQMYKKQTLL